MNLRKIKITIQNTKTKQTIVFDQKFNFRFKTDEGVNGVVPSCDVIINGLSVQTMNSLTFGSFFFLKQTNLNRFVLTLSIESLILFKGDIEIATCNFDTINYTIHLKCYTNFLEQTNVKGFIIYTNKKNITNFDNNYIYILENKHTKPSLEQILLLINNYYKLNGIDWEKDTKNELYTNDDILQLNPDCGLYGQIQRLNMFFPNVLISLNAKNNRLFVQKKFNVQKILTFKKKKISSWDIIGGIQMTDYGCKLKTFLNKTLNYTYDMRFIIESFRFPKLKSFLFRLNSIQYEGSSLTNEWYAYLDLVDENIIQQKF